MQEEGKLGSRIRIYRTAGRKLVKEFLDDRHNELHEVRWSPDYSLVCAVVASTGDANKPQGWIIYDVNKDRNITFIKSEYGDPGVPAFDGATLILPAQRATILYDLTKLEVKAVANSLPSAMAVALPGGRYFVTSGSMDAVRLWSYEPLKVQQVLSTSFNLLPGAVSVMALSPDKKRLATTETGGLVRLWDVDRIITPDKQ